MHWHTRTTTEPRPTHTLAVALIGWADHGAVDSLSYGAIVATKVRVNGMDRIDLAPLVDSTGSVALVLQSF